MSEFLAEARVVVTPDTTNFRVLLEAQLKAATSKPVPIPVTPVVVGGGVAQQSRQLQQATAAEVAALQAAGREKELGAAQSTRLAQANALAATASRRLALAEGEVANAASAVGAAQITATRSAAALTAAERSVEVALRTQDTALLKAARDTLALAEAQNIAATSALSNARAQAEAAATQARVRQGALAQGAALAGLRGSVIGANASFIAGTAAVIGFAKALQSAAGLETALNVFRVTAGATADEMERVGDTAKDLGRDLTLPGITASDAAETFLTLSRAGLSVQDSLDGARGTLQLAVAAQIGFADAAQLTASALNAFGLSGDEAVAIADTLTNAANASQASISEMGIALRQSAAIADLAGFSFSETATFLTQLARAGLIGSDAGTSFRVSIQRLIAPTDAARKALDGLRINLRDAQGNLRPEAFFELGEALERMGRAQGDATRQLIFGNDASRAAAFLARLNAEAFREQERALNKEGAAAAQAGARNAGLAGKIENAKNQITALGIELGELALPAVGVAVDGVAFFFGALATQIADTREALGGFGEDAAKLQEFFGAISDDSGFTDFANDVASGARLIAEDIGRASGATDAFVADLAGIDSSASDATSGVHKLTEEEKRLAETARDNHHVLTTQAGDLETIATAAQNAAGAIGRLTGQIAGIKEGVTRARISGDEGTELDLLEQERVRLQRLLAIQEDIVAEGGRGAATARRNIREQILPQLESVGNEIDAIISQQVSESKALADSAERARDERDRNILDAIGLREQERINAVIRAEASAGKQDDLKTNIELRNFYRAIAAEIRKTVKDAKLAAQAIAAAGADLDRAEDAIRAARQAIRQARREERERRGEGTDLDIELAQITSNESREIALRKKRIKQLEDQIKHEQGNTNRIKQLRNEIARQRQAIKDLQGEAESGADARNTAAEFFFSQLQAQQGFAANLMGNLITGPTAGLVGVPAPPSQGVRQAAAVQEGKAQTFPTSGQANTEISVLEKILMQLKILNGSYDAPEAITQKKSGLAIMDGIGGV